MTYDDLIADIINDIERLYGRVGGLRDAAESNEKEIFNLTRGKLGDLNRQWRLFRNSLPANRAEVEVGKWKD